MAVETLLAPIETTDLLELVDPSIPCQYMTRDRDRCPNSAQWIAYLREHDCGVPPTLTHRFFCDSCLTVVKAGDEWQCHACGNWAPIIKFITRIEPI